MYQLKTFATTAIIINVALFLYLAVIAIIVIATQNSPISRNILSIQLLRIEVSACKVIINRFNQNTFFCFLSVPSRHTGLITELDG